MSISFKKYYFLVTSDKIIKKLGGLVSLGTNAMAITIFPFIFVREDKIHHKELLRHEEVHIRQQIELLVFGALILYLTEYIYARKIKKLSKRQSYYFTFLEQEAHRNAMKENYLKKRKPYAMVKYLFDKKKLFRGNNGELIEEDYK